ncbi:MAG: peptidoglycan DD-metalloendopeptidase family protein [Rhodocyclaceae bacterium]|nr:peptidoglycan DD-metalloendopeptidase family protein [Rhodocyclaceae bacterium]
MKFRKPAILTQLATYRERNPEQFWVGAGIGAVSLFGMVAAFAVAPDSSQLSVTQRTVVEQLDLPKSTPAVASQPEAFVHQERVQRGDTIATLVARLGVQDTDAVNFLRTSREAAPINRQMRPGKTVTARTGAGGELVSLSFPLNGAERELLVEKNAGKYSVKEQTQPTETRILMKSGEIRSSLFAATDSIGLPDAAAIQMADVFGGDIDFHTDLRKGDRFSVVYEMVYSRGEPVRAGRILAAEFTNQGHTYKALFYQEKDDGKGGYYGSDGKPLRKAFLRSPLEFSRVTSGFTSSRLHPILHTMRAHKGVDYGAPIGTGVRATADGTVQFQGRQGGYGNFVVLKHQGSFSTAYGHLKGFASGVRPGSRVHQGDVIGYVGMTGMTSGPHLHYEFRIADKQVNPLTVALPSAVPLAKEQMAAFRTRTTTLTAQLDQIRGLNLAQSN